MAERRQHPRKTINLNVTMMMLEPVQGYVRDLSLGGIFVNSSLRLRTGDRVSLEIQVRGAAPIELEAEVVRAVPPIGAALKFVDAPKETIARLDALLKAEGKQPTGDIG